MRGLAKRSSAPARPLARFALPVSGLTVGVRAPTGAEDVLLAEGTPGDPALALALIERLASSEAPTDWSALAVTDADTIFVRLRQFLLGDRIVADLDCANAACGRRVDVSFGLDAYLGHHRPKPARGRGWSAAPAAGESGWFMLDDKSGKTRFRLPTLGDLIVVSGSPDPADQLARRCAPADPPGSAPPRALETAMRALAPALSGPIQGRCPDCGADFEVGFEARVYCLRELRDRARFVYDDVDVLAERYHWSEQAILALPNPRRQIYAERARQARLAWTG
jgi:hypothetical protein